jgi:hypothetical protein
VVLEEVVEGVVDCILLFDTHREGMEGLVFGRGGGKVEGRVRLVELILEVPG